MELNSIIQHSRKTRKKKDGMKINVEMYYRTECKSEPHLLQRTECPDPVTNYYMGDISN